MHNQKGHKDLLIGAVIGGVLGTAAALLLAPKAGKKLREDLRDSCCEFTEKTQDFAETMTKKGKNLVEDVSDLSEGTKEAINSVIGWFSGEQKKSEGGVKDLLIGSIAGGVAGAALGLLLAPKAGQEIRKDLLNGYENAQDAADDFVRKSKKAARNFGVKTNKWVSIANEVVDQLTGTVKDRGDEFVSKGKEFFNHKADDIMDLASLGIRLWQHVRK